ncbi:ABC transporter substrate-binding protein [Quadrisphaera sp. KR29]|uniref:ABC transporter substrate-binding protein n=1 Tax=Quadrisphaera sp. KR29 TaxID=3461391 RepID=UPI0040441E88
MAARRRVLASIAAAAGLAVMTAGCAGAGGGSTSSSGESGGGGDRSINVIMVNNPQMEDLQKLTADNFTAETGITVNYTVLPENDVRDSIQTDFSSQAGQYDVATISNYETPFFSKNGWIANLDDYVAEDSDFDQDDILGPIADGLKGEDGSQYAQPFYGESSFLMYRTDVFEQAGLTMPEKPTWDEVAQLAAQVDGAQPGMKGICLRGQSGWGQVFAPLTTVVNTFGGTWFDEDWNAQVNAPPFVEATQFYVDLVQQHGEPDAANAGFTECLNAMTQGGVAMWYDATSAAGSLEADGSPVQGKVGYVPAPVRDTASSGWLYSWAFAIQEASQKKDDAWEFISWASSKEYEELVGEQIGWSSVPAGKRSSTYENPDYQASAQAFYEATENAISSADPNNPGVQPRPAPGIQFVAIPEFAGMATQVSQGVSAAIAGQQTVQQALDAGQPLAQAAADANK